MCNKLDKRKRREKLKKRTCADGGSKFCYMHKEDASPPKIEPKETKKITKKGGTTCNKLDKRKRS